ncbi:retrovirus-related Pol polyprotein from transposon 297 isoform X2 [Bactrocera dorsalis]|uniref:Retrovirus-related Pol polyprotein from transposon 297 isoform X2 n=1 Tax=Bactrocera dorsalis TaxID=27457 RepID=A0ABM3JAN2_BACDO|nr:retrovirus-related Pol polyprotein from transposon 297 isoform X2 [Bactrocera dorsalis]
MFEEFSDIGTNKPIEFYIIKFHNFFDGLIGNDILRPLNACIDYKKNEINIGNKTLPMHFENENLNERKIVVPDDSDLVYYKEENGGNIVREGILNVRNQEAKINLLSETNRVTTQKVDHENFSIIENKESKPLADQIRIGHLNPEERSQLLQIIKEYRNIFYQENEGLSFTSAIKHRIRTTNNIPIFSKSYRYPYVHKEEVTDQIQEMLKHGIIRNSNSPYSAPIWIVPKKADASGKPKWRLVIDYRKLNEVTIDDKFPIPNIDEILEKLGRSQYFTTLDLAKGFHQIEIEEEDIHKTAFSVEGGHYEFLRMPFGLKTAPATFQRLMNNLLQDYINKICLVYLDDIIIFSTSLQEHMNSLRLIFARLQEANLKVQLDKSEFLKKETEFLGHIITTEGVKPNPKKIECVVNFPIPKTAKQIKQFLGLTGYYRKFIKDYSAIAKPMTRCLKKDSQININDSDYEKSFNTLKTLLTHDPILTYPNFSKTFTLTTDASNYALGAVLSQDNHPVCYASRTLNTHETNYSTIEKELLAIVWATKYFRPYLFGRKFIIETDHKPLTWLFSIKEPNFVR